MPATLVVIDMQAAFEAACDPDVVIAVTEEILATKQKGGAIVLVEYHECGPSHTGFYRLLRNYHSKSRIHKREDDGSQEIDVCGGGSILEPGSVIKSGKRIQNLNPIRPGAILDRVMNTGPI